MKKGLVVFLATLMSMSTITSFAGEYDTDKNSEQFEQKSNNEDFEKIEKKLKLYKIIKDRSYYDNKEGIELDDYLESYIGNEIIEQSDWLKEYARKNNISGNINIHRTGEEYIKKWVQEGDNKKITRAEALYSILKLIGLSDEMVEIYFRCCTYEIHIVETSLLKCDWERGEYMLDYINVAYLLDLLEPEKVRGGDYYLHTLDSLTVKDCLEMMNEFLSKTSSQDVIYDAKANGLLKDNDDFIDRADDDLTYEDLCVLLYRMATSKVYHYINIETSRQTFDLKLFSLNTNNNNITYFDLLDSRYVDKRYKNVLKALQNLRDRDKKYEQNN